MAILRACSHGPHTNNTEDKMLQLLSRRHLLHQTTAGFGSLALASLLERDAVGGLAEAHHSATAKSVIFLFMEGGPSQMDTFDRKPLLNELAGQRVPDSFAPVILPMGEFYAPLLEAPRKWKRYGESGLEISDWLPLTAQHADDLAVIRSCQTDGINHSGGVCQMNTGSPIGGRPSLGAWVSYGLGSENRNLPEYTVLCDSSANPTNGPRNWSAGFMPASFQGTQLASSGAPIRNLETPKGISDRKQADKLDLLARMNLRHASARPHVSDLEGRMKSYELAFRMQAHAPEAVDLSDESADTQAMYGLDKKETASFGRNCLLARRLVERGVRFVQLYSGSGSKWDTHSGHEKRGAAMCKSQDQPVAALLTDLKQRGLLEQTLVVWGGEFGRTPMSEKGDGRDHNVTGFTMWMAGGGIKGGQVIGATDELGLHAVEDRMHVHDIHASILHALGVNHETLTYVHKGRPERATQNEGRVNTKLFA